MHGNSGKLSQLFTLHPSRARALDCSVLNAASRTLRRVEKTALAHKVSHMAEPVEYKGYVLRAEPYRRGGQWVAKVIIERHDHGSVHFQPVADSPDKLYPTREEAEEASIQFGKAILDSRKRPGSV